MEKAIIQSTEEVFNALLSMDIAGDPKDVVQSRPLKGFLTGLIGLTEGCKGTLAIHFPMPVALSVAARMAGRENIEEIDEEVHDAVGELANILGEKMKGWLPRSGNAPIRLTLSSTLTGYRYTVFSRCDSLRWQIPFQSSLGKFYIDLMLEAPEGVQCAAT